MFFFFFFKIRSLATDLSLTAFGEALQLHYDVAVKECKAPSSALLSSM